MCFLILYFLLPFLFAFIIFISFDMLLIPTIYLFTSLFTLVIFSSVGVYFWVFLGISLAAIIYLALQLSNLLFKNLEDKRIFKFIIIFIIIVIILGFIHKKFIHTEMEVLNSETGEQQVILENFLM